MAWGNRDTKDNVILTGVDAALLENYRLRDGATSVSYTHLDVYKRQRRFPVVYELPTNAGGAMRRAANRHRL